MHGVKTFHVRSEMIETTSTLCDLVIQGFVIHDSFDALENAICWKWYLWVFLAYDCAYFRETNQMTFEDIRKEQIESFKHFTYSCFPTFTHYMSHLLDILAKTAHQLCRRPGTFLPDNVVNEVLWADCLEEYILVAYISLFIPGNIKCISTSVALTKSFWKYLSKHFKIRHGWLISGKG